MEYQRTLIADYAHVHETMSRYIDWGALFHHILDGPRAFRPRSAVRCTQIVGQLFQESAEDYDMAHRILRLQIAHDLRQRFWTHVSPLDDPIGCDLLTNGIKRQSTGNYTVAARSRKETAACRLPDFLTEHRTELQTIATYLAAHANVIKHQTRVERILATVIEDPRAALGQTSCWPLVDVIIVLQVPTEAALWTLDADFEPLTEALGLTLYRPNLDKPIPA